MAETTLETPKVPEQRPDTIKGWMGAIGDTPTATPLATPGAPAPNALSTTPPEPKPTPKPEVPAPAPEVKEDANELLEDKWPRSSEDWKKFKTARKEKESALAAERDALKKERDELIDKMKTLSSVTDAEEFKTLKKERDEMDKILRTANIRDNEKFKAHFNGKVNAQIELAKRIVGSDKGDLMAKLLQLPDSDWKNQQINDFVSEFGFQEQGRISGIRNALDLIDQEKQAALAVADRDAETIKEMKKAEEKTAQETQQKNIETLIGRGITAVTDPSKGHPAFQKRDNDAAWNSAVEKRVETVKQLLTGTVPPEKIFETAVHAVAYHEVLSSLNNTQAENKKLQEQIKALTAAQPSIDNAGKSGGGNGEQPTTIPIKHGSRPMEVTAGWAKGIRDAMANGG